MYFQCSACGHTFSSRASRCPKCGIGFVGERQIGARQSSGGGVRAKHFFLAIVIMLILAAMAIPRFMRASSHARMLSLTRAAAAGDVASLGRLLDRGADVNGGLRETEEGPTPLISAAEAGQAETVKFLLSKHARVHAAKLDGATAMSLAASAGNKGIVTMLLAADLDGQDASDLDVILRAYSSLIHDPSIYFGPAIPTDKLKLAVAAYAPLPASERPLALIDSTPGENGILLTNEAVYARKTGEKPARFPLRSISSARFVGDASSAGLEINGTQVLTDAKSRRQPLILFDDMLIGITAQLRRVSGQPAQ